MALKKDATEYGWVYVFDGMKQVTEFETSKKDDATYVKQDYSDGYTMQAVVSMPAADINSDGAIVGFAAQSTYKKDDVDKTVVTAVSLARTYATDAGADDSFAPVSYTGVASIDGKLTANLAAVTGLTALTSTKHASLVIDGYWDTKVDITLPKQGAAVTGTFDWSAVRLLPTEKKDASYRFSGKETRTNVLYVWSQQAVPTNVYAGTWKSSASALSAAAVALLAINSF